MAKTLDVPIPQGVTCTAKLFIYGTGTDTVAETIDTLTEYTNRKGWASGAVTVTGKHHLIVLDGTEVVGDFVGDVSAVDGSVSTFGENAPTVEADTDNIQTRIPAALVSGRMDSSTGAMAANTLTASSLAADAVTEIQAGLSTYAGGAVASVTGNVGGNVDGSVASVVGAVGSVTGLTASNLDATISSRASQTAVDDIPTNGELATALGTADDAVLAAIAALNNLSAAAVNAQCDIAISDAALATAANLATLAGKFTGITLLAHWLGLIGAKHVGNATARNELNATGAGSGTFDETTDSEQAIRDRGDAAWVTGSASGSGARLVTITVNDGVSTLQNAIVRMSQGAESYSWPTNASGIATFALDDATWTVTISKALYTFTPTTIVVNGTETATYSMTATVVTPPVSPSLSAVEVLCLDSAGQIEDGVAVDIRIITVPTGSQNIAFRGSKQTATSGVDGIARFEVVQGSTCEWKRGAADVWQQVAIDNDGVTNVTSVIGSP